MVSQRQTQKMALVALAVVFILTFLILILDKPKHEDNPEHFPNKNFLRPTSSEKKASQPSQDDPSTKHKILARDKFVVKYVLHGTLFNEAGRASGTSAPISTSVIHSFSPETEHAVAAMMVDPAHQQVFYANSPAMMWVDGELVVILRVWLEKEKYFAQKRFPFNSFQDNFLFAQKFDGHFRPLGPGHILGIPAPKQFKVGDGPIEPRIFKVKDKVLVSFNTGMTFPSGQVADYTVFWDYKQHRIVIPSIRGGSPMMNLTENREMARDKHWCAFDDHGELYMVYNIDPLRIIKCELNGSCHFVHFEGERSYKFGDFRDHARGGTPFELYKYPYYIGVAHVTLFKESNSHRVYTANFVVIHAKPYRVVYVSKQIRLHEEVMKSVPIVRHAYIDDPFIFPVGIILEDPDTLYLGLHISDYSSVVVRIRGLDALMKEVMTKDSLLRPQKGPPIHSVQNYVHEAAQQDTGYKLRIVVQT